MTEIRVLTGDCRALLRTIKADCVDCCVTSPPYFGLRDYGVADQIGLEQTPTEYVAQLVEVFREVRRVLKPTGTFWLNLGDSYASAWVCNRRNVVGSGSLPDGKRANRPNRLVDGLKEKDLIGIPWRVAFALQQDGWYLRQDIIWHKPNPMPESVRDRCTKAHEYLFMLSKSAKYYYNADAIKEKAVRGYAGSNFHTGKIAKHQLDRASKKPRVGNKQDGVGKRQYVGFNERYDDSNPPEFRNRRSVWTITTKPFKEAHFATFPPDLVEPCILAGSPQNGIVLDPFGGAGTTGLVARQHGRRAVLMELNPSYVDIANRRLFGDIKKAAK